MTQAAPSPASAPNSLWVRLAHALRWLTIEQWRAIDQQWRTQTKFDGATAIVLLVAATSLVLQRYYGGVIMVKNVPQLREWALLSPDPQLAARLYWVAFKLVSYLLLPVLTIKFVLRAKLVDFGLAWHGGRASAMIYAGLATLAVLAAYAASSDPRFLDTYPKLANAGSSWTRLLVWEAAYGAQFALAEFFFRGFLLFALARQFGALAIFVAVIPYSMIHYAKPVLETWGSMLGGITLGTLALRTRSIYGGIVVHCLIAWSMDLFALNAKGDLARLFSEL